MAKFNGKFESAKQEWETPDEIFRPLNDEFNFTLDGAASEENKKVHRFISESENGLTKSWSNERVWLNPPYGNGRGSIKDWVKKAYQESLNGSMVVMLIPARTNTNWFHDYCLRYGKVRFLRGRPKFGGATHGLPQPLCLVIFGKQG